MKAHIFNVKRKGNLKRLIPQIAVAGAVLAFFIYGFSTVPEAAGNENLLMTERAIRTALINCYAIEGHYPQMLAYLEEHYGLYVDYKKYVVFYDIIGSNIIPSVRVVPLEASDGGGGDIVF